MNGNLGAGTETYKRFKIANRAFAVSVPEDVIYPMGFGQFVSSGKLKNFLSVTS